MIARQYIEWQSWQCYDYVMNAKFSVSHDRSEESLEAKARWFRSLPMAERMEVFCAMTDLALELNPALQDQKDAQPVPGRIQVISAT